MECGSRTGSVFREPTKSRLGPIFFTAIVCIGLSLSSFADIVILQNGKTVAGTILKQDADGVLVQLDYGTARFEKRYIKEIKNEQAIEDGTASISQRIPSWSRIISMFATNRWVQDMKQVPATVIDNGVLKDVPYISFRCNGNGYEINIYGDLDSPAGFEIGAINHLSKNAPAKTNGVNFVVSVLSKEGDKKTVRALDILGKDTRQLEGMSFELTLPDEPDAYGGWWVSVYDEKKLANARATGAELLTITQPKAEPRFQPVVATVQPAAAFPDVPAWSPSEISYSRPSDTSSSSGGGRVFVRGYTRKDGTYVNSHTRSSARRH